MAQKCEVAILKKDYLVDLLVMVKKLQYEILVIFINESDYYPQIDLVDKKILFKNARLKQNLNLAIF